MRTSTRVRVVAAVGVLSSAVWASTFAEFTDDATSTSTFSTGTVNLEVADDAEDDYIFTSLSTSNMKPGDVKFATLKLENAGSLPFTYAMTSTESETKLSGKLELAAVKGAATCDASGFGDALNLLGLGAEVVIANGPLASAAISPRSLAPSASETLCFRVQLPSDADNSFQGLTTTSTFNFVANQ